MLDKTICLYCLVDDYFKSIKHLEDKQRKMYDAQVVVLAILAARYFHGNFVSAGLYLRDHHGVKLIDKSGLNRRLHGLESHFTCLFGVLSHVFKELNTNNIYVIDSFPVAVCGSPPGHNIRINRCKLLRNDVYRGYNSSKREYFYGFKLQVVVSQDGSPVGYYITAGSIADITAFQAMNLDLPPQSTLYADSAYTDYELEDFYAQCEDIYLKVTRKNNSKRPDERCQAFLKEHYRKTIEHTFNGITNLFPRSIHAVTIKGFILKLVLFLFAYAIEKL
ncbi:IS982 family transposase [Arcicella aquatica]